MSGYTKYINLTAIPKSILLLVTATLIAICVGKTNLIETDLDKIIEFYLSKYSEVGSNNAEELLQELSGVLLERYELDDPTLSADLERSTIIRIALIYKNKVIMFQDESAEPFGILADVYQGSSYGLANADHLEENVDEYRHIVNTPLLSLSILNFYSNGTCFIDRIRRFERNASGDMILMDDFLRGGRKDPITNERIFFASRQELASHILDLCMREFGITLSLEQNREIDQRIRPISTEMFDETKDLLPGFGENSNP